MKQNQIGLTRDALAKELEIREAYIDQLHRAIDNSLSIMNQSRMPHALTLESADRIHHELSQWRGYVKSERRLYS